jgi:prophage regulatory protein
MAVLQQIPLPPREGPGLRFLRLPTVRDRVALSRAQIYRLVSSGQFPRPYSLGARAVGWLESEIESWIRNRVEARRAS